MGRAQIPACLLLSALMLAHSPCLHGIWSERYAQRAVDAPLLEEFRGRVEGTLSNLV